MRDKKYSRLIYPHAWDLNESKAQISNLNLFLIYILSSENNLILKIIEQPCQNYIVNKKIILKAIKKNYRNWEREREREREREFSSFSLKNQSAQQNKYFYFSCL